MTFELTEEQANLAIVAIAAKIELHRQDMECGCGDADYHYQEIQKLKAVIKVLRN